MRAACALHSGRRPLAAAFLRKFSINTPYQIGKYTLSPFAVPDAEGRYRASLSIKSGRGSQICDRVFRYAPTFDTRDEAESFVDEQAQAWLASRATPVTPATASRRGQHG